MLKPNGMVLYLDGHQLDVNLMHFAETDFTQMTQLVKHSPNLRMCFHILEIPIHSAPLFRSKLPSFTPQTLVHSKNSLSSFHLAASKPKPMKFWHLCVLIIIALLHLPGGAVAQGCDPDNTPVYTAYLHHDL